MGGEWKVDDARDRRGSVAVVTGANSGLGFWTARGLASRHATVVLACRDTPKALEAMRGIASGLPDADLHAMRLDLAELSSVREFAEEFLERFSRLDILVNNAGVMACPRSETADGFEMQFGVNHLGHFALTGLLCGRIAASDDGRVVTVTSGAHNVGSIRFDDLQSRRRYDRWAAYAQSKLANLLFSFELHRRARQAGIGLLSVAAHPGYAATNLQKSGPLMDRPPGLGGVMELLVSLANRTMAQSPEAGALPQLYAALSDDVESGDFIGPSGFLEMGGYPVRVGSSLRSRDENLARRLWTVSTELTGVRYSLFGQPD